MSEILNLLKEMPEGLRGPIVEAMMGALAEESRQDNMGNKSSPAVKRVKTCRDGHPLKTFTTPKLRLQGDDFVEGTNISCDVCGDRIQIEASYMTCEDACNFDIHTHCFDDGQRPSEPKKVIGEK